PVGPASLKRWRWIGFPSGKSGLSTLSSLPIRVKTRIRFASSPASFAVDEHCACGGGWVCLSPPPLPPPLPPLSPSSSPPTPPLSPCARLAHPRAHPRPLHRVQECDKRFADPKRVRIDRRSDLPRSGYDRDRREGGNARAHHPGRAMVDRRAQRYSRLL